MPRAEESFQPDRSQLFDSTRAASNIRFWADSSSAASSLDNFRNTGYFNNSSTVIQVPFDDPTIECPVTFRQSATDADNHLQTNLARGVFSGSDRASRVIVQVIGGVRFDYFDLNYHNNRKRRRASTRRPAGVAARGRCCKTRRLDLALWQLQRFLFAQLRRPVLFADHDHAAGKAREIQQSRSRSEMGCASRSCRDGGNLSAGPNQHTLDRSERSDPHHPDRQPAYQRI